MTIRRVVPDIESTRVEESRDFYVGVLGFQVVLDLGFVITLASPSNPTAQITFMRVGDPDAVRPQVTVEVVDVDHAHAEAVRRGAAIVYPLTDEPWGCAPVLSARSQRRRRQRHEPPAARGRP